MKYFVLILSLFILQSCNNQQNKKNGINQQPQEIKQINDSLFISRIREFEIIRNKEKSAGVLSYLVKSIPTKKNPYYVIQTGKTNNYRFEVFFNFYCYPKTEKIELYDTLNDTLITPK